MHHHLATLLLGGRLHAAPIGQQPHRILDLGTGTGIWAVEMGKFATILCTLVLSPSTLLFDSKRKSLLTKMDAGDMYPSAEVS